MRKIRLALCLNADALKTMRYLQPSRIDLRSVAVHNYVENSLAGNHAVGRVIDVSVGAEPQCQIRPLDKRRLPNQDQAKSQRNSVRVTSPVSRVNATKNKCTGSPAVSTGG